MNRGQKAGRVPLGGPASLCVLAALFSWILVASAQSSGSSVWDGVFTEAQAKRGEAAYLQYCASCHGSALEGADVAPALVGGTFTSNWNDLTVGDLYERIRTTMPLDSPGKLSRQQDADVIAFLLKMNAWPSGASELAPDAGALKQVKIEATKGAR